MSLSAGLDWTITFTKLLEDALFLDCHLLPLVIQSQYLTVNILFKLFTARRFQLYDIVFLVYLNFACYRLVFANGTMKCLG